MEENILTVPQLVSMYPAFTEPAVRWWIFNSKTNGFNTCLIRIGGRVYVDKARFESWVNSQRVTGGL